DREYATLTPVASASPFRTQARDYRIRGRATREPHAIARRAPSATRDVASRRRRTSTILEGSTPNRTRLRAHPWRRLGVGLETATTERRAASVRDLQNARRRESREP